MIKQDVVFSGKLLTVRVDTVGLENGQEARREIVEHPGAAVIVAVDETQNVLLVRQYRYAVGQDSLELPAGTREKGEPVEQTAPRELEEETGYTAARWEPLGRFFSSPGILTEEMHLFLARDLAEGASRPEGDEDLHLVRLPLDEAVDMIRRGEIHDAKSIIGLLLAREKLSRMATP
ncbi:MAG: NUDIX hydrolase [Rudaea sp.]